MCCSSVGSGASAFLLSAPGLRFGLESWGSRFRILGSTSAPSRAFYRTKDGQ